MQEPTGAAALHADPRNAEQRDLHSDSMTAAVRLRAAGHLGASAEALWSAIDVNPFSHEAHLHLGNVLAQLWQRQLSREVGAGVEEQVQAQTSLADSAIAEGRTAEAIALLTHAARLLPFSPGIHNRIGWILWRSGALEQALVHYDLAVRFQPEWLAGLVQAGNLATSLGLPDRALVYLEAAQHLKRSDARAVQMALALPAIETSVDGIRRTRARCEQALDRLLEKPLDIPDPFGTSQVSLFYLAYHGQCNRLLNSKVAQVFTHACPQLNWVAPKALEPRRRADRIRVGFISHFMRDHSIGKTTAGLVERMSREQFEVHVINLYPQPPDDTARRLQRAADRYLDVEASLESARGRISALELDVLFYQDIGMESFGYFLAFSRLAPVQCVSYGHPDTTGIPTIDYFISNDLYEVAEASQHYSERLALLRDLPTLAYYHRPCTTPPPPDRAAFGMSEHENIYLCPQTLFKVHPEFDLLLAGILRRDPRARIVFLRNHCEQWRVRLLARLKAAMPDVAARISFLPAQPRTRFLHLLATADVILDTPHFNGMNSSLEAFATGAPVVTLPTSLQRGRHTLAMYKKMEIGECVAADGAGYVQIATRIGMDRAYRAELRRKILERNAVLFEDDRVTQEFERFFAGAVAAAGTDMGRQPV